MGEKAEIFKENLIICCRITININRLGGHIHIIHELSFKVYKTYFTGGNHEENIYCINCFYSVFFNKYIC